MTESYVLPREALRKLQLAQGLQTAVYLYGATGFGKTALVKHFLKDSDALWISCKAGPWAVSEELRHAAPGQCIVLDDLQMLTDETVQDQVIDVILNSDHWIVAIGRMSTPGWMIPLVPEMKIVVIAENDLHLSSQEIQKLAHQMNIPLSESNINFFLDDCEGNKLAICMAMERLKSGENLTAGNTAHAESLLDGMEQKVIRTSAQYPSHAVYH